MVGNDNINVIVDRIIRSFALLISSLATDWVPFLDLLCKFFRSCMMTVSFFNKDMFEMINKIGGKRSVLRNNNPNQTKISEDTPERFK